MTETALQELLDCTQQLLDSIAARDWEGYLRLCDPSLSAFEPEARGRLVEGMEFHRFYFDLESEEIPVQTTIAMPHVRLLGSGDAAIVSYTRLIQTLSADGKPTTHCFEETRVWEQQDGQWRHVHFHRSSNP